MPWSCRDGKEMYQKVCQTYKKLFNFLNLLLLDVVLVAFAVVVSNKAPPPVLPMCVNRWESECVFSMKACKMIRIPSMYN